MRVYRRFGMGETILAPVPQWGIQAHGRFGELRGGKITATVTQTSIQ